MFELGSKDVRATDLSVQGRLADQHAELQRSDAVQTLLALHAHGQ
nr:hypothetical protein [Lentzea pudingi]